MTTLREVPEAWNESAAEVAEATFYELLDEKAWQHLGLTGAEFRRRWDAGEYSNDQPDAVVALDAFIRTGEWRMPQRG